MNSTPSTEPKPIPTIEELELTLAELRSAVRASNPLLKAIASSSLYPGISLAMGTAVVAALFAARSAMADPAFGGFGAWAWIFLFLVLAAGGAIKVAVSAKLAAKHGKSSFYSLIRTILGGKTSSLAAGSMVAIVGGIIFLLSIGRAWYIVPIAAIYTGIASHALDILIDLPEYRVLGWASILAGIVSLFLIQGDPLLWTAMVIACVFILFGAVGLVCAAARKSDRR